MSDKYKYETKDSGERAEFDNDFVRDTNTGKARFDLVTPGSIPFEDQMLTRIAELMTRGAEKYSDRNWEKARGIAAGERFGESAFRHFMQWYLGVEDGEDHAAAVFFNIQGYEFVKWHMIHPSIRAYTISTTGGGAGSNDSVMYGYGGGVSGASGGPGYGGQGH